MRHFKLPIFSKLSYILCFVYGLNTYTHNWLFADITKKKADTNNCSYKISI